MQQQDVRISPRPLPQAGPLPQHVGPAAAPADWRSDLRRTVLHRVLPRLSDAGRNGPEQAADAVADAEAVRFCDLALRAGLPGLLARADALRADGLSIDALVEGVLASTARRLGDLWLADRLSFLDVTAGLGHLQGLLRALGPELGGPPPAGARRILLAPVPGEQHVFGLSIVAAFFRRAGWEVTLEPRGALDDLLALVRAEPFAAVGLSAACDRSAAALPAQIEALRGASLDPDVVMLAGGAAFGTDPDRHGATRADAVALDAAGAVRIAEALSTRAAGTRACS